MKNEIEHNEWILKYLNGELSEAESLEMQQRIERDPAFAKEIEDARNMHQVIIDHALIEIRDNLSQIHHNSLKIKKLYRNITGYGLGILLTGAAVIFLLNRTTSEKQSSHTRNIIQQKTDSAKITLPEPTEVTIKTSTALNTNRVTNSNNTPLQINKPEDNIQSTYNDTLKTGIKSPGVPKDKRDSALHETKPVPDTDNTATTPVDPCKKLKIMVQYDATESCDNTANGTISISKGSVKGGKAPYTFAIHKDQFTDSTFFSGLYPGSYAIYVKDANHCIVRIGSVWVNTKICGTAYEKAFAPLKGEVWDIPVTTGKTGVISVFSKSGNLVYQSAVDAFDQHTWDGKNLNNEILPMGIYQFVINYSDQEVFTGTVTLIK